MPQTIKSNFFYNVAYQILLILVPIVTAPYLARVLGPTGVGVYSYTSSVANYFVLFAVMGMSTYGVREIAKCSNQRNNRTVVFWEVFFSQVLIGVVVLVVFLVVGASNIIGSDLLLLWTPWILSTLLDVSWLFFGCEDFRSTTIRSFIVKLITFGSIFVFVRTKDDVWVYILIMSLSYFVNQIALWPFVTKWVDFKLPSFRNVVKHVAPNAILFLPVVSISLYTSIDKVIVGSLLGMDQAGYYEYADKIAKLPNTLVIALGTVLLPRITSLFSSNNHAEGLRYIEKAVIIMVGLSCGISAAMAAISPYLIPVFLGWDFEQSVLPAMILATTLPIVSFSNILGREYLIPSQNDADYTKSIVAGAAVNLLVVFPLTMSLGCVGAACSAVASECAVLITQLVLVRKYLPLRRYVRNITPFFIAGIGLFIFASVAPALFQAGSDIVQMMISLFATVCFLPLFLYLMKSKLR